MKAWHLRAIVIVVGTGILLYGGYQWYGQEAPDVGKKKLYLETSEGDTILFVLKPENTTVDTFGYLGSYQPIDSDPRAKYKIEIAYKQRSKSWISMVCEHEMFHYDLRKKGYPAEKDHRILREQYGFEFSLLGEKVRQYMNPWEIRPLCYNLVSKSF